MRKAHLGPKGSTDGRNYDNQTPAGRGKKQGNHFKPANVGLYIKYGRTLHYSLGPNPNSESYF